MEKKVDATLETRNEPTSLVVAQPSNIVSPNEMLGLEKLGRDDLIIPRVKLLQRTSAEVSNGATPGEWYNTLAGQSYGESLDFAVVRVSMSRTLFSDNLDEPPICRSLDGIRSIEGAHCATECPHKAPNWENGIRPKCAEAYDYIAIPHASVDEFPVVISLRRSGMNTARILNTLMTSARRPAWFWVYTFYSTLKTDSKGTYYVAQVRKKIDEDGKPVATSDDLRQVAEQFYHMAQSGRIKAEEDDVPF